MAGIGRRWSLTGDAHGLDNDSGCLKVPSRKVFHRARHHRIQASVAPAGDQRHRGRVRAGTRRGGCHAAPASAGMPALRLDHAGAPQQPGFAVVVAGVGFGGVAGGGARPAAPPDLPTVRPGGGRVCAVRPPRRPLHPRRRRPRRLAGHKDGQDRGDEAVPDQLAHRRDDHRTRRRNGFRGGGGTCWRWTRN